MGQHEAWLDEARRHHQAGRLAEAQALYRRLLDANPRHHGALHGLGLIAYSAGRLDVAAGLLSNAVGQDERNPAYLCDLGQVLQAQGKPAAAEQHFRRALSLAPNLATAHYNLGVTRHGLGRLEEAAACFGRAAEIEPAFWEAHFNLGNTLLALDRPEAAAAAFRRVNNLQTGSPAIRVFVGDTLARLGCRDDALFAYENAVALDPNLLPGCLQKAERLIRGARSDDVATAKGPDAAALEADLAEYLRRLGNAMIVARRLTEAERLFREAIARRPGFPAALSELGVVLLRQGRFADAMAAADAALASDPEYAEARFRKSGMLLSRLEFERAWHDYEYRHKVILGKEYLADPQAPDRQLPRPSSLGSAPLSGKRLLLVGDQGIGDQVFFLRFAPAAAARGARIGVAPTPKVASLLARVPCLDEVVAAPGDYREPDYVIATGELPLLLGMTSRADMPGPLRLSPLPHEVTAMRSTLAGLGPGPYLAVTWRGGSMPHRDHPTALYKTIPPELLGQALREWPGQVLVVQRQPGDGERQAFQRGLGREAADFTALNDDLEAMLALLALTDEYVGVSNTNMHLVAGLGKTARVLIQFPPEWRWTWGEPESPWFPGFTLYRQTADEDWRGALARLAADLRNRTAPDSITA